MECDGKNTKSNIGNLYQLRNNQTELLNQTYLNI